MMSVLPVNPGERGEAVLTSQPPPSMKAPTPEHSAWSAVPGIERLVAASFRASLDVIAISRPARWFRQSRFGHCRKGLLEMPRADGHTLGSRANMAYGDDQTAMNHQAAPDRSVLHPILDGELAMDDETLR